MVQARTEIKSKGINIIKYYFVGTKLYMAPKIGRSAL